MRANSVNYTSLSLLLNIDGIPLFNSSSGEFYPILFSVPTAEELDGKVFPVGIYYGEKKPDSLSQFLKYFIEELNDVINNGYGSMDINLLGFCCDTPAKSYILGITSHVGFKSCTRCKIHGQTVERRRVFLEIDCPPRTHEDFINNVDTVYQPRSTPLVDIPSVDFVKSFTLDYMHLICLGVLRTLLFMWFKGPLPNKMSKNQRDLISDRLLVLRGHIPSDFVRKPRPIDVIKSWKATELRAFLLYLGPVVLKGVLSDTKYKNFLSLHCASTIILRSELCRNDDYLELSRKLFKYFINSVKTLYGEMYISHNFHNLIHIVDDVHHFRTRIPNFTVHSVSAFPFENFLQQLKKRVRGHNKPLQQIGRRLSEMFSQGHDIFGKHEKKREFSSQHNDGPLPAFCVSPQYSKLYHNKCEITVTAPNNCVKVKNGKVFVIENFAFSNELRKIVAIGRGL
ncbi:uncharacterized protein LOC120356595 [Nilaparvata lugens]|uniref:uncharacterized protein LOC120356595 n=1 Tax=Nilaparvata lugens TaxID=108931 RepID=UPI00193E9C58|nr:uncharacterized protein LOC120356595 [Nilaparvata lugens]